MRSRAASPSAITELLWQVSDQDWPIHIHVAEQTGAVLQNTRGADKIIYAGYFPMGLTLERIFTEMRNVPLKDEVWPLFLRENAKRVFKMDVD